MFERFTDRARRVLILAQEEARLLNHSFIGTEHILLGLIGEKQGIAAVTLAHLGITLEASRAKVEEIVGVDGTAPDQAWPFTPRAKRVLELCLREAMAMGHPYQGTEHLLLGLIREGEGVGTQVLLSLGVELEDVRDTVLAFLAGTAPKPKSANSDRLHILEAMIRALEDIDRINEVVRGCPDRASAVTALMDSPFGFTEMQARQVLDLQIGSLTEDRLQTLRNELALREQSEATDDESG